MSKDHAPSGFDRPSGYKSDLEIGETMSTTTKVNTSFGGKQHNAYTIQQNGSHEHYFYNPQQQRSGYHGLNFPTKNNHPDMEISVTKNSKGETKMEHSNSFIESIKADKATIDRCNEVSRNAKREANYHNSKSNADEGGREICDNCEGYGTLGRESGNKSGVQNGHEGMNTSHGASGQGAEGQGGVGHGETGGAH